MINLKLLIWVTSDCNLKCPLCNQNYTIITHLNYQMSMEELRHIIDSCKVRGIRFSNIELIGGEPTLWKHLRDGVEALKEITDDVWFVTNGNDPELVISLGLKHWIVSTNQCTQAQLERFAGHYDKIKYNPCAHKIVPDIPLPDSLPAICNVSHSPFNSSIEENGLGYLFGDVYYCNCIVALGDMTPITNDLICRFEDDFVMKFAEKKFDKPACQRCLCNDKVWTRI